MCCTSLEIPPTNEQGGKQLDDVLKGTSYARTSKVTRGTVNVGCPQNKGAPPRTVKPNTSANAVTLLLLNQNLFEILFFSLLSECACGPTGSAIGQTSRGTLHCKARPTRVKGALAVDNTRALLLCCKIHPR